MTKCKAVCWSLVILLVAVTNTNGHPSVETVDKSPSEPTSKVAIKTSRIVKNGRDGKDVSSETITNEKILQNILLPSIKFLADDDMTNIPVAAAGTAAGILGLKQLAINKVINIFRIIFYATGTAFFICSILDCASLTGGGGGGLNSFLSRNDFDNFIHRQGPPVIQAIKNAEQLYLH